MKFAWVTPIVTRAQRVKQELTTDEVTVGVVPAFFNFFQGRATFFAIVFLLIAIAFVVTAIWGFVKGRDLAGLASVILAFGSLIVSIQGLLFAHSCKEDWVTIEHRKLDLQKQAQDQACNTPSPAIVMPTVQVNTNVETQ